MNWKIPVIVAGALIVALGFIPLPVLQMDLPEGKGTVLARTVRPGEQFSLGYIHSVELSPVWDHFRIDDSCRIILYETTFHSLNTGLPSTLGTGEKLVREGDRFRISGMNRGLPWVDLRVHEGNDNTLILAGEAPVKLYTLVGNSVIRIQIQKIPVWGYLYLRTKTIGASSLKRMG
jgi:hypothetical protein